MNASVTMNNANKATEVIRADDFVEYFLFPSLDQLNGTDIDEKLQNFSNEVKEFVGDFSKNYIWHKEPFQLITRSHESGAPLLIETQTDDELPPHLHGLTFIGENIQDEWFIVEILFRLTERYPDLIARIIDADGEFMLIEAAEVLPKWANPDTCVQRVYIHNGQILLVQNSPSNTNTELPVSVALQKIRQNPKLYKASDAIVECIKQRFDDSTPEKTLHRTTVYMPVSAVWILKQNPQTISAAVRAFCNRDPIDMRSCRAMKHFPPEMRVYTPITMTRCQYAMLTYQNYNPDRRIGWNLPHKNHETFKAHSLGMKIGCGLEILASQARSDNGEVECEKNWHIFLERLNANGYFGDNIEHSNGYQQRLEKAKDYFKMFSDGHASHTVTIAQDINKQLRNIDSANDQFKSDGMQTYDPSTDDKDDWLNITPEDLDKMLAQRYGIKKTINTEGDGNDDDDDAAEASNLGQNLEKFLNQKSEFDGIDYRPIFSEPMQMDTGNTNDKTKTKQSDTSIDFNPDAFQNHLKEMLDFVIPEDDFDSHSDSMSDFDDDAIDRNIQSMLNGEKYSNDKEQSMGKDDIAVYMEQMDRELAGTTIGKSFKTIAADRVKESGDEEDFDDIESFKPVDIDVNALQNLAASYRAQIGGHGPTASLLNSLGIRFDATQKPSTDVQDTNTNPQ